jgi:hypothetical protein
MDTVDEAISQGKYAEIQSEDLLRSLFETTEDSNLFKSISDIDQLETIIFYIDHIYVLCSTQAFQVMMKGVIHNLEQWYTSKSYLIIDNKYSNAYAFYKVMLKSMIRKGFMLRFIEKKHILLGYSRFDTSESLNKEIFDEIFKRATNYFENPDDFSQKDYYLDAIVDGSARSAVQRVKRMISEKSESDAERFEEEEINSLGMDMCLAFMIGYCYRLVEKAKIE